MEQLTNERGIHGAKHIARLSKRAAALEARFIASPNQVDFDDERAELKSLRWAIDQLRVGELTSPEYISRLRGVMGRGAGEQFGYRVRRIDPNEGPSVWRFADKDDAEICMRYRETYEVEPLYASPVAGEVKG